jgi:Fe-S cluster assembly protein SufD
VEKNAQKTDAKQNNQNLLLTNTATVNTKPALEIYADDVKCAHGATVGQLDQQALFYLRSRGIEKQAAIELLTQAFASEILDKIEIEEFRKKI